MPRSIDIFALVRNAPEADVRATLTAICSGSSRVASKATDHLDKLSRLRSAKSGARAAAAADAGMRIDALLSTPGVDVGAQVKEAPATAKRGDLKRKASSELAICTACGDAFATESNTKTSCYFHDGDLEVNDEEACWADHDENCHGEIDTEENREEYPEGFAWTCCSRPGDSRGCCQGKHEVNGRNAGRNMDES